MIKPGILNNTNTCTACGACVNICGTKSIDLRVDTEGFLIPYVDMRTCVDCGLCEKVCLALIKKNETNLDHFEGYAGWCKDRQLVFNSSSGGFFSVISEQIINDLGVVFGARYNYEKKRLEHCNTDVCDLSALRKSKYIESNTLTSFYDVKGFLNQGRNVLFCGTPCQVAGLKRYLEVLKVNAKNLLLVDFICHGVPSNEHFSQYLKKMEKQFKSEIVKVDFRSKVIGWAGNTVVTEYVAANGKTVRRRAVLEDPFFMSFDENILLRRSCYSCKAIHYHSSDITIGDFWGRTGVMEDDNTGISLLVINSEKGKKVFSGFQDRSDLVVKKLETSQFAYAYKREDGAYSLELRNELIKKVKEYGFVKFVDRRYRFRINVYKSKELVKRLIRYKR